MSIDSGPHVAGSADEDKTPVALPQEQVMLYPAYASSV